VADPTESRNLIGDEPEQAALLRESLGEILEAQFVPDDAGGAPVQLDDEQLSRLEALGYLAGGGGEPDLGIDPGREDPKDLIGFHVRMFLLTTLAEQGRHAEAAALGEELVRERPDCARGHFEVAEIALRQGDRPRALRHFLRAVEIEPGFFRAHVRIAVMLRSVRRHDEAITHLRRAIEIDPDRTEAHGLLGLSLAQQGRFEEAAAQFREVLRVNPNDAQARRLLDETLSRIEKSSR
jgi:tetratricopeptide (TPR) repeat protein